VGRSYPGSNPWSAGETNTYCGGTQVAASWTSENLLSFRFNSADGCIYVNGVSSCSTGEQANGVYTTAWVR